MDRLNSVGPSGVPGNARRAEANQQPDLIASLSSFFGAFSTYAQGVSGETGESRRPAEEQSVSSTAPAASSPAPTTASTEVAAAFLARPVYNFDRTRVSTASDAVGENRGVTDNQLILDKSDPSRAQDTVRQELGRQSAAEEDSSRRAEQARGTLDQSRGREQQLESQRNELSVTKAARQADVQDSHAQVDADTQKLQQQSSNIQQIQTAGEASRSRIDQLDGQVQQAAQSRDQATSDVQSSQQSIQGLQNQVTSLQQQAQQPEPAAGKGQPPAAAASGKEPAAAEGAKSAPTANGAPPPQRSGWAVAQQALTSTQAQLSAAEKQQEDAKRRQQAAEESLRSNQVAADSERQNLDRLRGQLDQSVGVRQSSQGRAQDNKQRLQQDLDHVKDLGSHSQDINSQMEEVEAGRERAQSSLDKNQANALAARQNVAQLEALEQQFGDQESTPAASGNAESADPLDTESSKQGPDVIPDDVSTADLGARPDDSAPSGAPSRLPVGEPRLGPGPTVQHQGSKVLVNLQSLNQGSHGQSQDTSGSLARHRSGLGAGDELGSAELAAAAAAAAPSSGGADAGVASSGPGNSGRSGGPPGLEKKGGSPPGQAKKGK